MTEEQLVDMRSDGGLEFVHQVPEPIPRPYFNEDSVGELGDDDDTIVLPWDNAEVIALILLEQKQAEIEELKERVAL